MDKVKVLIVDDHPIIREGLRSLLENEKSIEIVGEAADGEEAVKIAIDTVPQVVLMDICMPIKNGVEATREIRSIHNDVRIVILSSFGEDDNVVEAINAGACGYVLKDASPQQLVRAIWAAVDGYSLMSPRIAEKIQTKLNKSSQNYRLSSRDDFDSPLTIREKEVLSLIAQGLNNREIANSLSISEKTVKTHVGNIFSKLQISDRTQAVLYAVRRGIISPF